MSNVNVTIIGAGSVVFSLGLVKDLCLTRGLAGSEVRFMDIDEERLEIVYRLGQRYAEDLGAELRFKRTLDRAEALQGADFVIDTATVTHDERFMKRRRELTAGHGYFYGHSGMPEWHNLRLMLDVAQDMEDLCPEAWLLQAGNPVFDGTTLMARETSIKVCGLCHGHYGYRQIAQILGLDPDRVTWQAPGLNHNIWLTHFFCDGKDAYPLIDEWIANQAEAYWAECRANGKGIATQMSPAAVHQYRMFGLMPVGDTPRRGGWWYHTDLAAREHWYGPGGGGDTPEGRDRILRGKEELRGRMKEAAYDPKARPVAIFGSKPTTEQHIPIIDALVNDHEGQFQVNVPNDGALSGIPDDVAVEVPALVNLKGIQPLRVEPLPAKVMLEQIYPDWLEMERTLEAFHTGDKTILLWSVLESHQTRSYDQAMGVMEAILQMAPNEPMACVQEINQHFKWPENW
ncbi:MAG: alpha-glucosidase/alpha-galactosidase [Candidatus Latescibacterota bacterium]|jgi:alpha-galactosidase